jgi:leader peptidase (prepilin peptidase)/N-methyltransferase
MTVAQHAAAALSLFGLGAVAGSFLNMAIHRLPRGLSLWRGGSVCPGCGRSIAWRDNVPLVAWLVWLRGRCRHCREPIPVRYPAVEAVCGLIVVAVYAGSALRAGGDLLESPGSMVSVGLRLSLALTAAAAGWVAIESRRPDTARAAGWLALAPSLAIVAWSVAGP